MSATPSNQPSQPIDDLTPDSTQDDAEVKGGFNPQPEPPRELLPAVRPRFRNL